ncbi:hypothetical protein CCACVL1_18093 [Corchorus capsularis]|uniref:Uncharacterized protein n=1 Tax=Corchorus capsularis TaxID=210143 RepID=A0A1R3HMQ5_COCAP|nr:hypothetical protein CCACVL1_18093 [Corchorus capsularis]
MYFLDLGAAIFIAALPTNFKHVNNLKALDEYSLNVVVFPQQLDEQYAKSNFVVGSGMLLDNEEGFVMCDSVLCKDISVNSVANILAVADGYHAMDLKSICFKFATENLVVAKSFPQVLPSVTLDDARK